MKKITESELVAKSREFKSKLAEAWYNPMSWGQQAPAAQGAAPAAPKTRYKTPAEYDAEIARFSKTSDPKIPANTSPLPAVANHGVALGSSIKISLFAT